MRYCLLFLLVLTGCTEVKNPNDKIIYIGNTPNTAIYRLEHEGEVYIITGRGGIVKHTKKDAQ